MTSAHGEEEWQKMFAWGLSSYARIFHSYCEDIITVEGLQMTYAWHSWPLNSEGSLACHTYCTWHGASVYNSHLRGPATLTPIAERLEVELSLLVFTTHCANAAVKMFETSTLRANCAFRMMHLCFWLWVEYKFINPTLNITYIPIGQALGE